MHPIEAIQNYKAGQQLKAALKPVAKSSIGATEIGFDANQGKAVIATEDGGQLYTESITNGYRGPGQAVRVDRDGSVIVSDSMPRPKTPEIKTETPILYRKLEAEIKSPIMSAVFSGSRSRLERSVTGGRPQVLRIMG
jgi:hypothetical protein